MWYKTLTVTGLAMALALPAAAQQSPSSSGSNTSSGQQQSNMGGTSIRQHIQQGLEKDGFTDVKVAPAAFVAQAKDKQGRPVLMMINPDSITVLTEMDAPMQSGSGNSPSGSKSTN